MLSARSKTVSAAIMTAFMSVVVLGFMAIAIDGASFYTQKRRQQTATDLAAIAAASNPSQAATMAAAALQANGFGAATLQVETGTYTADPTIAPANRFSVTANGTGRAVRITTSSLQPFIFGNAFQSMVGPASAAVGGGAAVQGFTIRTSAVANNQDIASFGLGSGLAQLNGGVLNAVLKGLLGTGISLSALDYQALASGFGRPLQLCGCRRGPRRPAGHHLCDTVADQPFLHDDAGRFGGCCNVEPKRRRRAPGRHRRGGRRHLRRGDVGDPHRFRLDSHIDRRRERTRFRRGFQPWPCSWLSRRQARAGTSYRQT